MGSGKAPTRTMSPWWEANHKIFILSSVMYAKSRTLWKVMRGEMSFHPASQSRGTVMVVFPFTYPPRMRTTWPPAEREERTHGTKKAAFCLGGVACEMRCGYDISRDTAELESWSSFHHSIFSFIFDGGANIMCVGLAKFSPVWLSLISEETSRLQTAPVSLCLVGWLHVPCS